MLVPELTDYRQLILTVEEWQEIADGLNLNLYEWGADPLVQAILGKVNAIPGVCS